MACVFNQGDPGCEGEGEAAGGLDAPAEPAALVNAIRLIQISFGERVP